MNISENDAEFHWGRTIPDTRFDTDANGNIVFEGQYKSGTPTNEASWIIARYFYDANNNIIGSKIRTNISWDDRATIS
jgi:hypothetical protein